MYILTIIGMVLYSIISFAQNTDINSFYDAKHRQKAGVAVGIVLITVGVIAMSISPALISYNTGGYNFSVNSSASTTVLIAGGGVTIIGAIVLATSLVRLSDTNRQIKELKKTSFNINSKGFCLTYRF